MITAARVMLGSLGLLGVLVACSSAALEPATPVEQFYAEWAELSAPDQADYCEWTVYDFQEWMAQMEQRVGTDEAALGEYAAVVQETCDPFYRAMD